MGYEENREPRMMFRRRRYGSFDEKVALMYAKQASSASASLRAVMIGEWAWKRDQELRSPFTETVSFKIFQNIDCQCTKC